VFNTTQMYLYFVVASNFDHQQTQVFYFVTLSHICAKHLCFIFYSTSCHLSNLIPTEML